MAGLYFDTGAPESFAVALHVIKLFLRP